jgi:RNA polymerase sigma-70 factor (ECF subfamily)
MEDPWPSPPTKPAASSDGELVERVRGGDASAFAVLYRAHAGAVRRAVSDKLRSRDTIDDAVQDTFARALQNLARLRSPERFRPWLLAIARHVAIDQQRAQSRERSLGDDAAASLPSPDRGPDEAAELAELARLVEGCVVTLSPRDATAVALVTHLGLTPAEVAVALGVSVGSAKVIVHRARRRLRNALALEFMVRSPQLGCDALRSLLDVDAFVAAARHLQRCPTCFGDARREVGLYGEALAMPG